MVNSPLWRTLADWWHRLASKPTTLPAPDKAELQGKSGFMQTVIEFFSVWGVGDLQLSRKQGPGKLADSLQKKWLERISLTDNPDLHSNLRKLRPTQLFFLKFSHKKCPNLQKNLKIVHFHFAFSPLQFSIIQVLSSLSLWNFSLPC